MKKIDHLLNKSIGPALIIASLVALYLR